MSTLSVTHATGRNTERSARFSGIASYLVAFAETFSAARRLAIAAEMGRPADPADLRIIGVKGQLPPVR